MDKSPIRSTLSSPTSRTAPFLFSFLLFPSFFFPSAFLFFSLSSFFFFVLLPEWPAEREWEREIEWLRGEERQRVWDGGRTERCWERDEIGRVEGGVRSSGGWRQRDQKAPATRSPVKTRETRNPEPLRPATQWPATRKSRKPGSLRAFSGDFQWRFPAVPVDFRRRPVDPRRPVAQNPSDPRPMTRWTREKTRFSMARFPATFPAKSVAFFGGFIMKILGVISYNLWWFIWGFI